MKKFDLQFNLKFYFAILFIFIHNDAVVQSNNQRKTGKRNAKQDEPFLRLGQTSFVPLPFIPVHNRC